MNITKQATFLRQQHSCRKKLKYAHFKSLLKHSSAQVTIVTSVTSFHTFCSL